MIAQYAFKQLKFYVGIKLQYYWIKHGFRIMVSVTKIIIEVVLDYGQTVRATADHYNFFINSIICRKQTTTIKL